MFNEVKFLLVVLLSVGRRPRKCSTTSSPCPSCTCRPRLPPRFGHARVGKNNKPRTASETSPARLKNRTRIQLCTCRPWAYHGHRLSPKACKARSFAQAGLGRNTALHRRALKKHSLAQAGLDKSTKLCAGSPEAETQLRTGRPLKT